MQGISCGSGRFLLVSIPGTAMSELIDSLPQTLVHLATSFGIAFLVGLLARSAFRMAMIVTAAVLVTVRLAHRMGWDLGLVEGWIRNGSAWAGRHLQGFRRTLAALVPSAVAAVMGGLLGFRRARI